MTLRRTLLVAATALAAIPSTACSASPPAASESDDILPEAGLDARFAGTYSGSFTYVASLMSTPTFGQADAGSPPPEATGVRTTSLTVDDTSTDPSLPMDGLLFHVTVAGTGTCELPGTVTARRYDPSGGYVQLPLTIASATLSSGSPCVFPVDGGTASFTVATSYVKLYADGSLELLVAGPIAGWPGATSSSGTFELMFFGQRPPPGSGP